MGEDVGLEESFIIEGPGANEEVCTQRAGRGSLAPPSAGGLIAMQVAGNGAGISAPGLRMWRKSNELRRPYATLGYSPAKAQHAHGPLSSSGPLVCVALSLSLVVSLSL